jgi:hypothetical protein
MNQITRLMMLAGAATIGVTGPALAETATAAPASADEVRAIVAEMMADAETRSSLLQSGGVAGHDDGGFYLADSAGNFRLNVGGQIQFRYYLNFRDDASNAAGAARDQDDFESGFQTRRTKLIFDGYVYDPNLFYKIQTAFDFGSEGNTDAVGNTNGSGDGSLNLEDAFVGYKWDNGFQVRWGQFKLPFLREELVDDLSQLAADRGLVNSVFSGERSQGVELGYNAEDFRVMFAFSDGFRANNSDFASNRTTNGSAYLDGGESDYAATLRGELKLAGAWEQFQDFTSTSGSDFALLLGAAGHVEGGDRTSAQNIDINNTGDFTNSHYNYYAWTIDLSLEGDGFNIFIAGTGGHSDYNDAFDNDNNGVADVDSLQFNEYGLVGQAGIMIPNTDWEPFIRYDGIFADEDERGLGGDDDEEMFNVITFGINYYMYGHASRFTADVLWFIDDVSSNTLAGNRDTGIGYLTDDNDNEITIRFQWQLQF